MAYNIAQKQLEVRRQRQDLKIPEQTTGPDFEHGDLMYTRNRSARGRNKIQDLWDPTPYQVMQRLSEQSVAYSVVLVGQNGPVQQDLRIEIRWVP